MKIFPAIDIKDKKCVRLIKGDFQNKTEYETSPVDQAGKYKDHGFNNLHIVDLDGALTGKTVNLDIIKEIVSKYDLKIEIGGGIRTADSIKQYIDAGVEKVILGSGAIKNKEFLKEACEKFKNKIALGLDAKDGNLSVSGWKENLNIKTVDFLKEVNNYGVSVLISLIGSINSKSGKLIFTNVDQPLEKKLKMMGLAAYAEFYSEDKIALESLIEKH